MNEAETRAEHIDPALAAAGWSVVEGLTHDEFAQSKLAITTEELVGERDEITSLGLI